MREWLNAQAARGYVTYTGDGRYELSEEQATAFTDESSPACVVGGFQVVLAATRAVDRLTDAFRSGEGVGWHEHHQSGRQGRAEIAHGVLDQRGHRVLVHVVSIRRWGSTSG